MSYDLAFWRQTEPGLDPRATYQSLIDGEPVAGLAELPIDDILSGLQARFPGAVREPNGESDWLDWVAPDQSRSFQVEWSARHLVAFCRGLPGEEMNAIMDVVADDFGCPLYDPQTAERFAPDGG